MSTNSTPVPTDVDAPYWDGARRGVLVLQRCTNCATIRHYPRLLCAQCHSFDVEYFQAEGSGQVASWTVAHHAFEPAFTDQIPYALLTVDMAEGIRVLGRFSSDLGPSLRMPVRIKFLANSNGVPIPWFIPVAQEEK